MACCSITQRILQLMCNDVFIGQCGIDHLTRLLVELNLINWVDVFGKNFKICFQIITMDIGCWDLVAGLDVLCVYMEDSSFFSR